MDGVAVDEAARSLLREGRAAGGESCLTAASDSMRPLFGQGDGLVVRGCSADDLRPGMIIVYEKQGMLHAHRLLQISNKSGREAMVPKADRARIHDEAIGPEQLLGRVVAIRKPSREMDLSRFPWKQVDSFLFLASRVILKMWGIEG